MSSLLYHPIDISLSSLSFLVTLFFLNLMKRSYQDSEHWHELEGWEQAHFQSTHHDACQQWVFINKQTLSKLHDANCWASTKWSPFRHSSCSHSGTFSLPFAFLSQRRRTFAFRAFSSLGFVRKDSSHNAQKCGHKPKMFNLINIDGCHITKLV